MKLLKPSLSDADVQEIRAVEEAVAAIRRAKLSVPTMPVKEDGKPLNPQLTSDLANTTSDKLGKLLTQFSAVADYAAYAAALADIEATVEEHTLEIVTARVRLEKTGTVAERADKTTIDPRVRRATELHFKAMALARLTQVLLDNYERDLSAVSREITRRGQEMNR